MEMGVSGGMDCHCCDCFWVAFIFQEEKMVIIHLNKTIKQEKHRVPLKIGSLLLVVLFMLHATVLLGIGQENDDPSKQPDLPPFKLVQAVMCERVKDQQPVNPTVILSVSLGKAACFTAFESISEKTYVVHNWIRKDVSVTKVKLFMLPPRWSSFSSIHLREIDKGPWRVEVSDSDGNILQILRFSITD
jgi:hypothetical protein